MPETRNRQNGALLRAVEASVRAFIGDSVPDGEKPGKYCGIGGPSGRPPAMAGTYWYSVHSRGLSGTSQSPQFFEAVYGFCVTISMRVNAKPNDRIGNALLMEVEAGLHDRVDALAFHLHGNYALMHDANARMRSLQIDDVDIEQGFVEPILFQNASDPTEQGVMWFGGDPTKASTLVPAGYSSTLNFSGAKFNREKS